MRESSLNRRDLLQLTGVGIVSTGLTTAASSSGAAATPDDQIGLDNVGSSAWQVALIEGDAAEAPLGEENPTISLEVGARYSILNEGWSAHPLELRDENADPLLSQEEDTTGRFEDDEDVEWVHDGVEVIFTLTDELAAEVETYICTVHPSMEGQLTTTPGEDVDDGPVAIEDWNDLDAVREDLEAEYELASDLDQDSDGYDEHVATPDEGWDPIGDSSPFTGTFDGRGNEISDLTIDREQADPIGLFANVEDATVMDITLSDVDVSASGEGTSVGSLIGNSEATEVTDITASGEIRADVRFIGGIVGESHAEATVSDSSADVEITGNTPIVGGLVGSNDADVTDASTSGSVTGGDAEGLFIQGVGGVIGRNRGSISETVTTCTVEGDENVGGLVGYNDEEGDVDESSASEQVTGNEDVGGLVGRNDGHVEGSSTDVDVDGTSAVGGSVGINRGGVVEDTSASGTVTGESDVGGLVGTNGAFNPGTITSSSAATDVTGESSVGGLVGIHDDGEIENSSASGTVTGESSVGGLVGITTDGAITNSSAGGTVTGDEDVGGLVGFHQHTIEASSASGEVTGEQNVGGLVGFSNETIRESSASGDVSGSDGEVGGLVGTSVGEVIRSSATGDVTGSNSEIGGLIGNNTGDVIESAASGDVTSTDSSYTGGLVGDNVQTVSSKGVITDCNATGDVDGDRVVGGLVGRNSGRIENSFSAGQVTAEGSDVGGLVGRLGWRFLESDEEAVLRDSYWDTDVADQSAAVGDIDEAEGIAESRGEVTGLLTTQMQGDAATESLSTLDFVQIWTVRTDPDEYPSLRWRDDSAEEPPEQASLQLQFDIDDVSPEVTFPVELTVEETAGVPATDVAVTLTVDSPADAVVYEETIDIGELTEDETVTFGADTPEVGPFEEQGEYEATADVDAADAEPVSVSDSFSVTTEPDEAPSIDTYTDESGVVQIGGVLNATNDYSNGEIGISLMLEVISAYSSGEPV